MTDQEVEKMLNVTFYRLGLDPKAIFYANYLWWSEGEQKADEWIRRYKAENRFAPQPPPEAGSPMIWSGDYMEAREARKEMERFYRREIKVEFTRVEKNYWINQALALADAHRALLTQMLQLAGFPAKSPEFTVLQGKALGEMQERERAHIMAYMDAERVRSEIAEKILGDGAEPTATGATIAERNKQG
jgi:hypothetical protein